MDSNNHLDNKSHSSASSFPSAGLQPKSETQAADFISQFPNYDGRGVRVAVFDTGVDPGASGLSTCTDGSPKVVDVIDASGGGDVDTSQKRKANQQAQLQGLSGRTLQLDLAACGAKADETEFLVGVKRVFDLFPKDLAQRCASKRREEFDRRQAACAVALRSEISACEAAKPETIEAKTARHRKLRDLETRLEQLAQAQKEFVDHGPLVDVVVFRDPNGGDFHRVIVDTSDGGDLRGLPQLCDFRRERQYARFSELDLMNFSVNVHNGGNVVSIVTCAGAHGTHVAGIVAAHFPDCPDLNGVAPGAQIVSVKIGDGRLGSMETNQAMIRGLRAALDSGCHIINMSYGEATSWPNGGRFAELASELIHKHSVIFVSSAGNSGPALNTVGSPGGTSSAMIGVGAWQNEAMQASGYGMRAHTKASCYTWSSRGPTTDGALGVDICAPGGAIAPIPQYCLSKSQLMNGTSMSSPNAAGGIALLVSGLEQRNVSWSPAQVKRAVKNSARRLPGTEPWASGQGLLQVASAFEALCQDQSAAVVARSDVRFAVTVPSTKGRGIYLRDAHQLSKARLFSVRVKPEFDSDSVKNLDKQSFEVRVSLTCSAQWVQHARHVFLNHSGRAFEVEVDPQSPHLADGANFAEIVGFDSERPHSGALFRVPVTVIKPTPILSSDSNTSSKQAAKLTFADLQFSAGHIERRFIAIPSGASHATITVSAAAGAFDTARRFVLHAVHTEQVRREQAQRHWFALEAGQDKRWTFRVQPNTTWEATLAQSWNCAGHTPVAVEIEVFGLQVQPSRVDLGSSGFARVDISSQLARQTCAPSLTFTHAERSLAPEPDATPKPLPDPKRDLCIGGLQNHEIVLTYKFDVPSGAGAGGVKITPRWPLLDQRLYDSVLGGCFWLVFDSNKHLLASGDAYEETIDIPAGNKSVTICLQLLHTDPVLLERFKALGCVVRINLDKTLSAHIAANHDGVVTGKNKIPAKFDIDRLSSRALFLSRPDTSSIKWLCPGDGLVGRLKLASRTGGQDTMPGNGIRCPFVSVRCTVPPKVKASTKDKKALDELTAANKDSDDSNKATKQAEKMRDAQLKLIKDATGEIQQKLFEILYPAIREAHPKHTPTTLLRVQVLNSGSVSERLERSSEIRSACDDVLSLSDQSQLLAFFGAKNHTQEADLDPLAKRRLTEMESERDSCVEALAAKCDVLLEMANKDESDKEQNQATKLRSDFSATFAQLSTLVDTATAKKLAWLHLTQLTNQSRTGEALKFVQKQLASRIDGDSAKQRKWLDRRRELFSELGWEHHAANEKLWAVTRFPAQFALF